MKKEDLEIGKVYWVKYYNNMNNCWLLQPLGTSTNKIKGFYIGDVNNNKKNCFGENNLGNYSNIQECRLATQQEVAHLNACIAANKYIPLEDINFNEKVELNYEIY